MQRAVQIEVHKNRDAASQAAAEKLTAALRNELSSAQQATLVVSGGTTPTLCFDYLAGATLPWDQVAITLSDERRVPAGHKDSNQQMVRQRLLQRNAQAATFHPLSETLLADVSLPFAAVLVGMGDDGHFASIFPDMPNLPQALDLANTLNLLEIKTAASALSRTTMTLQLLCRSREIILLAFGQAKRDLIDNPAGLPINALFQQTRTPVQVIWAA